VGVEAKNGETLLRPMMMMLEGGVTLPKPLLLIQVQIKVVGIVWTNQLKIVQTGGVIRIQVPKRRLHLGMDGKAWPKRVDRVAGMMLQQRPRVEVDGKAWPKRVDREAGIMLQQRPRVEVDGVRIMVDLMRMVGVLLANPRRRRMAAGLKLGRRKVMVGTRMDGAQILKGMLMGMDGVLLLQSLIRNTRAPIRQVQEVVGVLSVNRRRRKKAGLVITRKVTMVTIRTDGAQIRKRKLMGMDGIPLLQSLMRKAGAPIRRLREVAGTVSRQQMVKLVGGTLLQSQKLGRPGMPWKIPVGVLKMLVLEPDIQERRTSDPQVKMEVVMLMHSKGQKVLEMTGAGHLEGVVEVAEPLIGIGIGIGVTKVDGVLIESNLLKILAGGTRMRPKLIGPKIIQAGGKMMRQKPQVQPAINLVTGMSTLWGKVEEAGGTVSQRQQTPQMMAGIL
jgi:hypothetical protein